MIEFKINGKEYTEAQFKKDMTRMFDSFRLRDSTCFGKCKCNDCSCDECQLNDICANSRGNSFQIIEKVYKWSKEHPVVKNSDKLKEIFGIEVECVDINNKGGKTVSQKIKVSNENDGFNACYFPNYDSLEFSMFETLKKWLDEEYKEPHKETGKEND